MIGPQLGRGLLRAGSFPAAVFVLHALLSLGFNAYDRVYWIDVPVHFLGGVAIGWFFSEMILHVETAGWVPHSHWTAHAVMVFGLVALAAVVWELGEFTFDLLTAWNVQESIPNVMRDQLMGLLGGAAIVALRLPMIRRQRTPARRP